MPIIDLGWRGKAVRDCPNVIVPPCTSNTTGSAIVPVAGNSWAWGAYRQVVPAAGAGSVAYPFLLHDLIAAPGLGVSTAVDGLFITPYFLQYGVTTGAPGSEIEPNLAYASDAASYAAVVSGLGGASPLVTIIDLAAGDLPLGPLLIPANTRIALRATTSGAPTVKIIAVFLSGYDLTTLGWTPKVDCDELLDYGSRPTYPKPLIIAGASAVVTTGNPAGTFGAYVTVLDPLDGDYLLEAAAAIPSTLDGTYRSTQFDMGIGAAGSEVVQSRFCAPQYPGGAGYAYSCRMRWPYRVIAYKGERVSVRAIAPVTVSRTYKVNIYGTRLS